MAGGERPLSVAVLFADVTDTMEEALMIRWFLVSAVCVAALVAAGCSQSSASSMGRAEALQPLAAGRVAERGESASTRWASATPGAMAQPARLFSAPAGDAIAAAKAEATADASVKPAPVMGDRWWQKPLAGRSFGEVLKDDIKTFLPELWKSTQDSANVTSLTLLGLAGGLSVVSRGSWDDRVDNSLHNRHDGLFDKEGDFGSVAGSPLLHFGVALAGYGIGVQTKNDELYGTSKTLLQALTLTGITTQGLKWAAHDHSPNGESWAWPSGHTSSTAAVAGVLWEKYGWQAGVPMYLLTGWVAASRLEDREHWLSDVIFGAVLGSVIGHSVAQGRALEVGGFTVLPWVHPQGGAGLMFAKQF